MSRCAVSFMDEYNSRIGCCMSKVAQSADFILALFQLSDAAERLMQLSDADPLIVPALVADGHLEGYRYQAGFRISRDSVLRFKETYRSVAFYAKQKGTSARRLLRSLTDASVPVLTIKRGYGKGPQCFVSTHD